MTRRRCAPPPTRIRRRRVCYCPYCYAVTPVEPKARGEDCYISVCWNSRCSAAFDGRSVASWLEEPL